MGAHGRLLGIRLAPEAQGSPALSPRLPLAGACAQSGRTAPGLAPRVVAALTDSDIEQDRHWTHGGQAWPSVTLGVRNSIPVSLMGGRNPSA